MADSTQQANSVAQQLAKLRADYLSRLPGEFDTLENLARALTATEADRPILEDLHHRLHKLSGSGGTFGMSGLSLRARSLEQRLKVWLHESMAAFTADARDDFIMYLAMLRETIAESESAQPLPVHIKHGQALGKILSVWLVEDDVQLGRELVRQLESFNYVVHLFSKIHDAELAAKNEQPHMLIMDVMFEAEGENATTALQKYPNLHKLPCPLIFISSMDDFQSRIRAAQLGAIGYFLKPLDVPRLVGHMMEELERRSAPPQRVLIIDDDVDLTEHYRLVLTAVGMDVQVLHDPGQIIEKISAFHPELVLIDMMMPEYSGPDLAGVIRQYDKWASLPIVYLSAEVDLSAQIEAMGRGADDFLTKPISDAHLVAALHVRIERARHLESQIARDSLTGLLKHASIKEAIEIEVVRARRNSRPVSVAMLDIDHFKLVNDNFGHATGDVVISAVAMLLRQRLRQSDIIGRYGGEEFAAILQDCDAANAKLVLDDIRRRFASLRFSHEGKDFSCTISAGVVSSAHYPHESGSQMLVAADEALYFAKRNGRNQVQLGIKAVSTEGGGV